MPFTSEPPTLSPQLSPRPARGQLSLSEERTACQLVPPPSSLLISLLPSSESRQSDCVICFSVPNLQWRVEDIKELFIFGDGGIVDCFLNQTRLPWRCQVKYLQMKKGRVSGIGLYQGKGQMGMRWGWP